MGRPTWIDADGMKKGEWTAEEDRKLVSYINEHDVGDWSSLPKKADLQRSGKSCRLRWLNYLRPGIKRGKFTAEEEESIIQLHAVIGNRWAAIAKHLSNRTDNDVKNHWNSCLKKRLARNGIDPATHEPIIITQRVNHERSSSSSSSSSHGSVHLLNKLATNISTRQQSFEMIKMILSETRSDQEEEEEERNKNSNIDEANDNNDVDLMGVLDQDMMLFDGLGEISSNGSFDGFMRLNTCSSFYIYDDVMYDMKS